MTVSNQYCYKIADIGIKLTVPKGLEFSDQDRFPDFSGTAINQVNYHISVDPPGGEPAGALIFDSGQSWRLYGGNNVRTLWVGSRDFVPRMVGNFNPDYRSGEIRVTPDPLDDGRYFFPLGYPLGELLMVNLLGTGCGIMLHSCGVIDADDGIVFAGVSTAGKTTTARLWLSQAAARVINDDHTIIRKNGDHFQLYGTPWHGEGGIALAADAPLKKIFILKHAPQNQAVRLSPAQAAAMILVRMFAPLWSVEAMAYSMQFLDELCNTVPCYELGFVPDQSAVEYVRCLSSE